MTIFWPALLGGVLCLGIGVALTIHRTHLARTNADAQRAFFGKASERTARNSTPGRMGLTGIGFMLMGAALIVASFLNLNW